MYIISLERIPLPRLSTYVYLSLYSFITSIAFLLIDNLYIKSYKSFNNLTLNKLNENQNIFISIFRDFLNDSWCFWSFINLAYCALLILGRMFQDVFFGELRPEEQSHIIEKFWNFVFYKLVFIYGILNVQSLHELLLWTGWSSILGFLHLLTNLAKERYEFMIQSAKVSLKSHIKIIALLIIILIAGNFLTSISIWVGVTYSYHLMLFMVAEVFQLTGITIYVLINYGIYFYVNDNKSLECINMTKRSKLFYILENKKWYKSFNQMTAQYYTEFYYAIIAHIVDFMHNLHMLLWNNIKINMTGLVIGMHLQYLYYDLSKRYSRHVFYLKIVRYIENNFPIVNKGFENCAICWESLNECRRLPCCHFFHDGCLRLWFENSVLCPSCKCTTLQFDQCQNIQTYEHESSTEIAEVSHQTKATPSTILASDQSFNASLLNGNANYIHSIYPTIPLEIIYQHLIAQKGDVEKVISKINNGHIRGVTPKLYTGPMQVELAAACHDHEFLKSDDTLDSIKHCLELEKSSLYYNDISKNIFEDQDPEDDLKQSRNLFMLRKKEMFTKYTEKYKNSSSKYH